MERNVEKAYKTIKQTPLYGNYYLPVGVNEEQRYMDYGFFWPRKEDLVELGLKNPNFKIQDLILEKICWKPEGLSFSMIQLVFRNGIKSPIFHVKDCDTEDYLSSLVKPNEPIKWIKLKVDAVEEDVVKFVVKFQFLNVKSEGKEAEKAEIIGQVGHYNEGDDKFHSIPAKHKIVGVFGITASNKYPPPGEKVQYYDHIRGLGFITMDLSA